MVAKPASHSKSNFTDMQSVSLIENTLAAHGRVMPNLSTVDKWPNIDGRVEVQDENYNMIGPLSVQAKTLPFNHNLKFSCPVSFLSYCEIEPCLLLGVDNQTGRIYWKYFDSRVVQQIDFKNNKHTKTLYFDESQYLDKSQKDYIQEWVQIIEKNKRRLKEYDEVKDAYEKLRKNSNEIVGAVDKKFINIHQFLDELNKKYDIEFPTAKSFFYPNTWKLGLAYENYDADRVGYTIFPIPWDKNDVQIKKVDPLLVEQVRRGGLGFTGHFQENPIEGRPMDYAKEVAGSQIQKIVQRKLLSHGGSEILAREFVIAFIDKFREQMGLREKDEYTISEVQFAFNDYLPHWVEEAYKLLFEKERNNLREQVERKGYFDPDVLWHLRPEEREEIRERVNQSWEKGASVVMANSSMDIGVFLEYFNYLKSLEKPITRLYKKADYSRLSTRSGWVWNKYSVEDAEYNLRVVFDNLEDAYDVILENNFPAIKNKLDLFERADEIRINFTVRDEYVSHGDGPTYQMYYLQSKSRAHKKSIKFIDNEQADRLHGLIYRSENKIDLHDQGFKLISAQHSVLDFLYEDTPLLDFVYQLLEARLTQYLAK